MAFFRKVKARYRRWRKWRAFKKDDFPFRYTGPTVKLRGNLLEHGVPLVEVHGPRGTAGGQRWRSPDGVTRLIHKSQVKER